MQVEKIQIIKNLVQKFKENPVLRYCCGFEVLGKVPSELTFSRFLDKLAETAELEKLFHELVIKVKQLNIIDGDSIAIDSTKLNSYETAKPKKSIVDDETKPNWGMKKDTNGNNIKWFGWKLHIVCDCKSEFLLYILITPASTYDGSVAIPLIEQFLDSYKNVFKPTYNLMDSEYDFEYIYSDIINRFNGIPIIAYNSKGSYAPSAGY